MKIEGVAELIKTATEGVFRRMLGTKVSALGFFWDEAPLLSSEVAIAVCLHGDISGCISLHCTETQAKEFTRRMLKLPPSDLTWSLTSVATVRDAMSELINMVAGEFRSNLEDDLWIEMTLPFFSTGMAPQFRVPDGRGIVAQVDDPSGAFQVEVTLVDQGTESG